MLDGAFPVNMFTGVLVDHDGHSVELKSMDVLELGFVNSYNWPRKEGSHLVFFQGLENLLPAVSVKHGS